MATYQVVIARYLENIQWVEKLKIPHFIYNKGPEILNSMSRYNIIARPENMGRESETYLYHIIENYDQLPDYLVLLQGNPFDHCPSVLSILENHPDTQRLIPLGSHLKRESLLSEFNWPEFKPAVCDLLAIFGIEMPSLLRHATGAQYLVPKQAILQHPKKLYEQCIRRLNYSTNPVEGWVMERIWPYIFGTRNYSHAIKLDIFVMVSKTLDQSSAALEKCANSLAQAIRNCQETISQMKLDEEQRVQFNITLITDDATQPSQDSVRNVFDQSGLLCSSVYVSKTNGSSHLLSAAYLAAFDQGQDLIYFTHSGCEHMPFALTEAIQAYFTFKANPLGETDPILSLIDHPFSYALENLHPSRILAGPTRYWRENKITPNHFLIHHSNLLQHWDLFLKQSKEIFQLPTGYSVINQLSNERQIPTFTPMPGLITA